MIAPESRVRHIRLKLVYLIIAVLVLVGAVPLYFFGSRLIKSNRDVLRTKEREYQTATTRALAVEIGFFQRSTDDSLLQLADSALILSNGDLEGERVSVPELRGLVEDYVKSSDNYLYASILNRSNHGVTASRIGAPDVFLQRALDRAYVASSNGEQSDVSIAFAGGAGAKSTSPTSVMVRSRPLMAGGQVVGVVMQVEDFSAIQRRLNELSAAGLECYVVDALGKLIAAGNSSDVVPGEDLTQLEIVRRFLSWKGNPRGSETTSYLRRASAQKAGAVVLATYAAVPELRWAVIAQRPEAEAFASADLLDRQEYMLLVVTLLGSLGLGLYFSTRLTRPLQLLSEKAHALARRELSGHISLRDRTEIGALASTFNTMADEIERYVEELKRAAEMQREMFLGSVRLLAQAVDEKDPYTRGHSDRVSQYSERIAQRLGLEEEMLERVRISAQLHDVGKIVIDDAVLKKPGVLTPEEFALMKLHTIKGANIVRQVERMRDLVPGIELHHEALDGSGYPYGLKGEQIPLLARIIAVADTFDAMTTTRPYQMPRSSAEVVSFIQSKSGIRYAPEVVRAFVEAYETGEIIPAHQVAAAAAAAGAAAPAQLDPVTIW